MTVGFAASVLNGWLDTVRTGGSNFTTITTLYIQLHTGDPGAAGTSNVSAGDATRKSVTQAAPATGSMALNGTPPEWTNGTSAPTNETITHISSWSALTAGTFKYSGQLSASKAWANADILKLNTLTVSLTPLAA